MTQLQSRQMTSSTTHICTSGWRVCQPSVHSMCAIISGASHMHGFAILKHSLLDGGGVLAVSHDAQAETVHVSVDRSKISSHGKPSLGRMLCCIQIWRCIADVESCRSFYQPLSAADGAHKTWRHIVAS